MLGGLELCVFLHGLTLCIFIYKELPEMSFAENFKTARKALKLTQEDVAKLLNIDRTAVAHYENGTSYPRAANIPRISEILRIPVDEMFK